MPRQWVIKETGKGAIPKGNTEAQNISRQRHEQKKSSYKGVRGFQPSASDICRNPQAYIKRGR